MALAERCRQQPIKLLALPRGKRCKGRPQHLVDGLLASAQRCLARRAQAVPDSPAGSSDTLDEAVPLEPAGQGAERLVGLERDFRKGMRGGVRTL